MCDKHKNLRNIYGRLKIKLKMKNIRRYVRNSPNNLLWSQHVTNYSLLYPPTIHYKYFTH